jgi:hypothetical protein
LARTALFKTTGVGLSQAPGHDGKEQNTISWTYNWHLALQISDYYKVVEIGSVSEQILEETGGYNIKLTLQVKRNEAGESADREHPITVEVMRTPGGHEIEKLESWVTSTSGLAMTITLTASTTGPQMIFTNSNTWEVAFDPEKDEEIVKADTTNYLVLAPEQLGGLGVRGTP